MFLDWLLWSLLLPFMSVPSNWNGPDVVILLDIPSPNWPTISEKNKRPKFSCFFKLNWVMNFVRDLVRVKQGQGQFGLDSHSMKTCCFMVYYLHVPIVWTQWLLHTEAAQCVYWRQNGRADPGWSPNRLWRACNGSTLWCYLLRSLSRE